MDEHGDMLTKYLQVPDEARGSHYNERSGLIILSGPRGPLLARYANPTVPPDPERFKFQTTFPRNYTTYKRPEPPAQTPGDVTARARPIEKTTDPRMGVQAGPATDPINGSVKGRGQSSLMQTPNRGANQSLPEMRGMEITESQTDIRGSGAGILVGDKIRMQGGLENPATTTKGLTRESPLKGLVPETIITFFAASMLPDLEKVMRLKQLVTIIRKVPRLVRNVIEAGRELTS